MTNQPQSSIQAFSPLAGQRRKEGSPRAARILLLALMFLAPSMSHGAISEPSVILFGNLDRFGLPSVVGTPVEARLKASGELLDSSVARATENHGEIYAVRIGLETPLSGEEPRSPGIAWTNDVIELYVAGQLVDNFTIDGRGQLIRLDLSLLPSNPNDLDDDGIPNTSDNCGGVSNPLQLDVNGDGIGDACETLALRQLSETLLTIASVDAEGQDQINAGDPKTQRGSVGYSYAAGATEVTNIQYRDFLMAVARDTDPHGLFNILMQNDPRGGILREGDPGDYFYRVRPNMGLKPINFVSWMDAARYVNWLRAGEPTGEGALQATDTGAFDLTVNQPGINATIDRDGEGWSLPTEDEWYKAAFYDPATEGYRLYAQQTDSQPIKASASAIGDVVNPGADVANYARAASWNGQTGHLTSAGSAEALSPYGLLDAGGNVAEWLAADSVEEGKRLARGGSYKDARFALESTAGDEFILRDNAYEGADTGFRVVFVPEPSAGLGLIIGSGFALGAARRKERKSTTRI